MKSPQSPSTCTVAVVMPRNSFANRQRYIGFFREAAANSRITVFYIDSFHPVWIEKLDDLMRLSHIQAIVTVSRNAERIRKLRPQAKLLVLDDLKKPKSHPFHIDDEDIGRTVAEFFIARGYRHLAYVNGDFDAGNDNHSLCRLKSFRRAAHAAQAEVVGTFQLNPRHFASTALRTFLENLPKPCGIFAYNDNVGMDLLNFCRLNGFSVPDTFSIVGVDNDEDVCEACVPTLSSVAIDFAAAGRAACRILLDGSAACQHIKPPLPQKIHERSSTQSMKSHGRIVTLAQTLISRYEGRVTAAELANLAHVSSRTLQLGFKYVLGKGPKEAILDYRFNRAQKLLTTTDRPITEIADLAAFPSISNFCYRFSKRYGLSPTEYRKQLLNG